MLFHYSVLLRCKEVNHFATDTYDDPDPQTRRVLRPAVEEVNDEESNGLGDATEANDGEKYDTITDQQRGHGHKNRENL